MAIPELEKRRVARALDRFCDKVPAHVRDKLTHHFRFVRSDVELYERRPHYREPDRFIEQTVAKFRYNGNLGSWTLFWADRNLRWHSYQGFVNRSNFLDLLAEVETDPTHIFWG